MLVTDFQKTQAQHFTKCRSLTCLEMSPISYIIVSQNGFHGISLTHNASIANFAEANSFNSKQGVTIS